MRITWKLIKPLNTFISLNDNTYVAKVMNTKRLITKPSKEIKMDMLNIYIYTLYTSSPIGYVVQCKTKSFIINKERMFFVGTRDLRPRQPKIMYEDICISIFRFGYNNFLFLLKNGIIC